MVSVEVLDVASSSLVRVKGPKRMSNHAGSRFTELRETVSSYASNEVSFAIQLSVSSLPRFCSLYILASLGLFSLKQLTACLATLRQCRVPSLLPKLIVMDKGFVSYGSVCRLSQ